MNAFRKLSLLALSSALLLTGCTEKSSAEGAAPAAAAAAPAEKQASPASKLVGKWGVEGEVIYDFRADGTGNTPADEETFKWSATATHVSVNLKDGTEMLLPYTIEKSGHLVFDMEGEKTELEPIAAKKGTARN